MVVVGLILASVAAGLAIMATDLVAIVRGPPWLKTPEPLRVLCSHAVCAGFSGVMVSLNYGLSQPDFQTRICGVRFGVNAATLDPLTQGASPRHSSR